MAVITSDLVQKLRTTTGAGMMDCKRALASANGDFDKAIKTLREQGAATAAKRAGRATGDGLITTVQSASGKSAVLIELNCETDFVARTPDFQNLLKDVARELAEAPAAWQTIEQTPESKIKEIAVKLGENIALRPGRFKRFDKQGTSLFSTYIHPTGDMGKVGVLLELGADKPEALASEDAKVLARDLAMQVAATNPRWVAKEDVPASIIEQEQAIAREQAKRENKPEKIWDKISQGKVQQFHQQFCLLEQPFVKDTAGKTLVSQLVGQVSQKIGAALKPLRFVRFKVGEEE